MVGGGICPETEACPTDTRQHVVENILKHPLATTCIRRKCGCDKENIKIGAVPRMAEVERGYPEQQMATYQKGCRVQENIYCQKCH